MTNTVTLATAAPTLAASLFPNATAFITQARETDTVATPFARSLLASVVGGIGSMDMAEKIVIAAAGSPVSAKTGKPVKNVSGLRNFVGGSAVYQAIKALRKLIENIDADEWLAAPNADADKDTVERDGIEGARKVRSLIVGFILETEDSPSALFGPYGLVTACDEAMTAHAKSVANHNGVTSDGGDADGDKPAPITLAQRAAALLVAVKAASDDEVNDAYEALAAIMAEVDRRIEADADGKPEGETVETPALETVE